MVQHGHREDRIERAALERLGHEIALEPRDRPARVSLAGSSQHRSVHVDGDDLRDPMVHQIGSEHAVATADVQDTPGIARQGVEEERMVVNVVVPGRQPDTLPARLESSTARASNAPRMTCERAGLP